MIVVGSADRAQALARDHAPSHIVILDAPPIPDRGGIGTDPLACFEADLRSAPQHEELGGSPYAPHPEVPGKARPRRTQDGSTSPRILTLAFHDIAEQCEGLVAPGPAHLDALVRFGRSWTGDRPLLVQCRMGISRSTAAALVLACDRCPETPEIDIARALRAAAPCATPNPLMIALADERLGSGGRLVAAVAAIGRGADYVPQTGFVLRV